MTVRRCVLVLFCLLMLGLTAVSGMAKVPPGSFITQPVASGVELADLVQEDRVVALRYSKHFGMDAAALADYFQNNLTATTLEKAKTFTIYFIATNGRIISHRKTLKAGSTILTAWNGDPIMDLRCGNPMTKNLPQRPAPPPPPVPKPAPVPPTTSEVIPQEPVELAQLVAPEPTLDPEPVVQVLAEPPMELTPVTEVAPLQIQSLLVPGILGAVGALSGGGGGTPVVPEPTSLLVLGIGGLGLAAQISRKITRR